MPVKLGEGQSANAHTRGRRGARPVGRDHSLCAWRHSVFTLKAPYIVNIPPMVPHSFKNIGKDLAELVVIFPTNVWEYDVLDYFPFHEE